MNQKTTSLAILLAASIALALGAITLATLAFMQSNRPVSAGHRL